MTIPNPIIKINDRVVHDPQNGLLACTSYQVNSTFMEAASTFTINFTDFERDAIFTNDRVEIILDDTTIIKGMVDSTEETISNDSFAYTITGRDYAGWWLSNDATPVTYKNVTDNAIILDIISQAKNELGYGIDFIYNLGKPETIKEYVIGAGKDMYTAMGEVANIHNYYMHFDNNGVLNKQHIASTGTPVAFFDLENNFEGTANIKRSISDSKSDVWLHGSVSKQAGNTSLPSLKSVISSGNTSSLTSLTLQKSATSRSQSRFLLKQQRPDGLYKDNKFRLEGRALQLSPTRAGSTFRRRIVSETSKRIQSEIQDEINLQFEKTAPTFDITITMNKLYNIVVNQLVRVKYKDMDSNFVVHSVSYSDSINSQQTTLGLKLPGRIR